MKNISALLLLMMATFGFWVFSSAYILDLFRGVGTSHRIYLGLFTVLDLLEVILFCVWAFLIARLGSIFFTGPSAFRFCFVAAAFVVLVFLDGLGAFFPSNFGFEFLTRVIILAALVSLAARFGLQNYPIATEIPKKVG